MKKIAVLMALVLLTIAGVSAGQEAFGPRLAIREFRHDLGKVRQGTQVSHVFELRNEGTDTLVIEKVLPG
jgi:hypothetical protein